MKKMKKGQISTEYIIILGMVLFALIPLIYYATQLTTDTTRINDADTSVRIIGEAANRVYSLGPGNKETVSVSLPSGTSGFDVTSKGISLKFQFRGTVSDVSVTTNANLTGSLPQKFGTYTITLFVLDNGVVNLSYAS